MKKLLLAAAALIAVPASAAQVLPGSSGVAIDQFSLIAGTQGTQLAYRQDVATALTFQALVRQAVYKNTNGTMDFYYQVVRLGPGNGDPVAGNDHEIFTLTGAQFGAFQVFAYREGPSDIDGAGPFTAANNPSPFGFTSTAGRTNNGNRVEIEFGANGLVGTETSAVYVLRTNAVSFKAGTFGLINGSAIGGPSFAPTVPEPATWAMMIGGFGLLGAAARRSSRAKAVLA
jgi:hypothetical protein